MRRLLVIFCVLSLALPGVALGVRSDPSQGTFSLVGGKGTFMVNARGGVIGSFAKGRVIITDPVEGDGTGPIVSGDDWQKSRSDTTTVFGGTRVRFRLIGGRFTIRVIGTGVNLSVVARGMITLSGLGSDDDGSYSVNGGDPFPVPDFLRFPLVASSP
jgi:hypothetical protein